MQTIASKKVDRLTCCVRLSTVLHKD